MRKNAILVLFPTILIILIVLVYIFSFYRIKYNDDYAPGKSYNIVINKFNKKMTVKVQKYCSSIDCNSSKKNYSVVLTNEEYQKIKKIISKTDKDYLCSMLESLARNNEETEYNGIKTTYRNLGNELLNELSEK